MSTSLHTPGPWELQLLEKGRKGYEGWNSYCVRDGKTNVHIASVGQVDRYFEKHNEANARLIAAAPELLAALEALKEWGCTYTGPLQPNSPHALLIAAHAAIAKAKGGPE